MIWICKLSSLYANPDTLTIVYSKQSRSATKQTLIVRLPDSLTKIDLLPSKMKPMITMKKEKINEDNRFTTYLLDLNMNSEYLGSNLSDSMPFAELTFFGIIESPIIRKINPQKIIIKPIELAINTDDSINVCSAKNFSLDIETSVNKSMVQFFPSQNVESINSNNSFSNSFKLIGDTVGFIEVVAFVNKVFVTKVVKIIPIKDEGKIILDDTITVGTSKNSSLRVEGLHYEGGKYSSNYKGPFNVTGGDFSPVFYIRGRNLTGNYPVIINYKNCTYQSKKVVIQLKNLAIKCPKLIYVYPNLPANFNISTSIPNASIIFNHSKGLDFVGLPKSKSILFTSNSLLNRDSTESISIETKSGFYSDSIKIKVRFTKNIKFNLKRNYYQISGTNFNLDSDPNVTGALYFWKDVENKIISKGQKAIIKVENGQHQYSLVAVYGADTFKRQFTIYGFKNQNIESKYLDKDVKLEHKTILIDTFNINTSFPNVSDEDIKGFVKILIKRKDNYEFVSIGGYYNKTKNYFYYFPQPEFNYALSETEPEIGFIHLFCLKGNHINQVIPFKIYPGLKLKESKHYVTESVVKCQPYLDEQVRTQRIPKGNADNSVNISLKMSYIQTASVIVNGTCTAKMEDFETGTRILTGLEGQDKAFNKPSSQIWELKIRRNPTQDKTVKLIRKLQKCQIDWRNRIDIEFNTGLKTYFYSGNGKGFYQNSRIVKQVTPP